MEHYATIYPIHILKSQKYVTERIAELNARVKDWLEVRGWNPHLLSNERREELIEFHKQEWHSVFMDCVGHMLREHRYTEAEKLKMISSLHQIFGEAIETLDQMTQNRLYLIIGGE